MRRSFIALSWFFLASTAYSAEIEGWSVEYFPDAKSPTGCTMGTMFQDGTRLNLVVYADYKWGLALSNTSWRLSKDGHTEVTAYVDRSLVASGRATYISPTMAVLPLSGSATYKALQEGHRLDIRSLAGNLSFSLKGTSKAMTEVLSCVQSITKKSAPAEVARPEFEQVPLSEAAVLLTNLFNTAGIQGYSLHPPKADQDAVSFNLNDGTVGFFRASRGLATANSDDYAALVIGRWSGLCKGDFMSGKKAISSTDGSLVRKVVTTCRDGNSSVSTETTIIRNQNGFLMELSLLGPDSLPISNGDSNSGQQNSIVGAAAKLSFR